MISFEEARRIVVETAKPLGTESVGIERLVGRTIAEDLVCPFDVPHFDNSSVDGYAVRSEDGTGRRIVAGVSAAGDPSPPKVGRGQAVRILTGAPMPEGADAVIMQEDTGLEEDVLDLRREPSSAYIRRRGEEMAEGTRFETHGRIADPPLVGLAASFGYVEVEAYRLPRVAVVATGAELVMPGSPLGPGQVYASNPLALAAAVSTIGLDASFRIVDDEASATETALAAALDGADVLITTGGVSVGDHDLVRPTLARLGVEEKFWRVAMKPGKPFYFGVKGEKLVFGLPGNPVSALVTFHVLVRPALRKLLGLIEPEEEFSAVLGAPIRRKDLRYEFVRATVQSAVTGPMAIPVAHQGSHMQSGLAGAECLIHCPEGIGELEAGARVRVTPLGWR